MLKDGPLLGMVMMYAAERSIETGKVACLFETFMFGSEYVGLKLNNIVPSEDKTKLNPEGNILEREGIFGETIPANKFILIITPDQLESVVSRGRHGIYIYPH